MIIVKLNGGLGNQMFQYAAGRRLAHVRRVPLKLDISAFKNDTLRSYGLDHFNIHASVATEDEIEALRVPSVGKIRRLFNRLVRLKTTHIRERSFCFDSSILDLPNTAYLDGYWQSGKYFSDIHSIIQHEFTVKTEQHGKNKEIADMIQSQTSVSIHVRRADFVTNPEFRRVHGICTTDYYVRGIEYIAHKVHDPHFFIFSDDFDWVRDNISSSVPCVLVDHNGTEHDFEDVRLMSQCDHAIIANSSFSWWGAWLNNNPDKIIVGPQQWFAIAKRDTKDLIPHNWIQL